MLNSKPIKQAVIPAAGLGSRFLPTTKCTPKELIPLVDRPCIDHVVDEAIAAGVEEFIFVISKDKEKILDYYKPKEQLNKWLVERGQTAILAQMQKLEGKAKFDFVYQDEPLGLGHAVLCARPKITGDWFFVILPDDIIDADTPVCKQMAQAFATQPMPLVSVMSVGWDEVHRYGIVEAHALTEQRGNMVSIVEKPKREEAPSNLAVVGRYILPTSVFNILETLQPGSGGEIQLTDALSHLMQDAGLHSWVFNGVRHDTGNPLGWIKANIGLALKNEDFRGPIQEYIKFLSATIS